MSSQKLKKRKAEFKRQEKIYSDAIKEMAFFREMEEFLKTQDFSPEQLKAWDKANFFSKMERFCESYSEIKSSIEVYLKSREKYLKVWEAHSIFSSNTLGLLCGRGTLGTRHLRFQLALNNYTVEDVAKWMGELLEKQEEAEVEMMYSLEKLQQEIQDTLDFPVLYKEARHQLKKAKADLKISAKNYDEALKEQGEILKNECKFIEKNLKKFKKIILRSPELEQIIEDWRKPGSNQMRIMWLEEALDIFEATDSFLGCKDFYEKILPYFKPKGVSLFMNHFGREKGKKESFLNFYEKEFKELTKTINQGPLPEEESCSSPTI